MPAALEIARSSDDRRTIGRITNILGSAYLLMNKPSQAIEFYQESLTIAREFQVRPAEGSILALIGMAYYQQGNFALAVEFWQLSLPVLREVNDVATVQKVEQMLRSANNSSF